MRGGARACLWGGKGGMCVKAEGCANPNTAREAKGRRGARSSERPAAVGKCGLPKQRTHSQVGTHLFRGAWWCRSQGGLPPHVPTHTPKSPATRRPRPTCTSSCSRVRWKKNVRGRSIESNRLGASCVGQDHPWPATPPPRLPPPHPPSTPSLHHRVLVFRSVWTRRRATAGDAKRRRGPPPPFWGYLFLCGRWARDPCR